MVQILMSTYNGESYLKEQIESILAQTYGDIQLLIRDDGSTDSTIDILRQYSKENSNIHYYTGSNMGAQASFFDLFKHVDGKADYIATCDQDDVWLADKIESAVDKLKEVSEPALYCSRLQLVDKDMSILEDHLRRQSPAIAFGNALIENICTGCTMVINRKLFEIVDGKWPKKSTIHDWWFYQIALCFGTVVYDETPHIYYRQHGNNEIGLDSNRIDLIRRQLHSLRRFSGKYTEQMKEILETFPVDGEKRKLAELMVATQHSWKARFKIVFEKKIFRQGKFDTLLFKGMLFFGIL